MTTSASSLREMNLVHYTSFTTLIKENKKYLLLQMIWLLMKTQNLARLGRHERQR